MFKKRLHDLLGVLSPTLKQPTGKQKEAYGRLMHTLCAASWIGAITIMFSEPSKNSIWYHYSQAVALMVVGAVLFLAGAILSKGE